jgi:predicted MFS family arabinose efflux permease
VSEDRDANSERPAHLPGGGWPLLLVLAGMQFCHLIDFVIMIPLGPRYARELSLDPMQFSVLVAAYAFGACLSGLLSAFVIDRFDRKRAFLFLYAGFTAGTLLCGLAPSYGPLLAGRCIAGAFGGLLGAMALAIVGDVFPEERRGLATGVVMSAFSVATIVGVPLGLVLAQDRGTGTPFVALAALSAGMLLLGAALLPPVRHHLDTASRPGAQAAWASFWGVLVQPAHLSAYALMVALVLGMFTLVPSLPTFLIANVGWREADLPWMYLCGGLATLATNPQVGRLADRFGKLVVFRVMAGLTMVVIVVLTNLGPTSLAATLVVTTLLMVSTSGRMVPALAMITSSARPAYRGSFLSVLSSVQQLAMGLAALLAGALLHRPGRDAPLEGYPLVGLLACATTALSIVLAGAVRPAAQPEVIEPPAPAAEPLPLPEPVREAS